MRDWPTLLLLICCYLVWGLALFWLPGFSLTFAVVVAGLAIALHASLQHEMIHGHPFRDDRLNAALVFPALNLLIPYARFRDTHLEHHRDAMLTDPYDDPETNYLDPVIWEQLPRFLRRVLTFNNTLLGRLLIGPIVAQVVFMQGDAARIAAGDRSVRDGWLWHLPAMALVLACVALSALPLWAYLIAAYIGLSILKLRTYLEHQAHESARGRTVVIEDRGLFALLFLNNNFHVVHHMHPQVSWFRLPALYRANRDKYLRRNHGYVYRNYWQIIRSHLLRAKDPVHHPLWRGDQRQRPLPERAARKIQAVSSG